MLVIKINARLNDVQYATLVANINQQAKYTGVITLPHFCDLLYKAPADEEIKVVQKIPAAKDVVKVPAGEWQAAMEYIRALHDCATCKHETDGTACLASDVDCTVCAERERCACANCHNGSGWEWRHDHGKD